MTNGTRQTPPAGQSPFLKVESLQVHYGGIEAVKGISFEVYQGQTVALIGANGAGKTSTLKAITGLIAKASGEVWFEGQDISRTPGYALPGHGLIMVPEGRGIFTRMTILENLLMGTECRRGEAARTAEIQADMEAQFAHFPRLKERQKQLAGTLSGGEQQMLAMARALMARPRLLLLDEPSMGLSPIMVDRIFEVVRSISQAGTTLLLVEQNARLALQTADYGYVLESGLITQQGSGQSLLASPAVRAAYLGEESV